MLTLLVLLASMQCFVFATRQGRARRAFPLLLASGMLGLGVSLVMSIGVLGVERGLAAWLFELIGAGLVAPALGLALARAAAVVHLPRNASSGLEQRVSQAGRK